MTKFLVDSGAEISILPESHALVAHGCKLESAKMRPVLVDGSELPVKGVSQASVIINGEPVLVNFYIVQANISPILGSDIMRGFSWVQLDFENQAVTFGPYLSDPLIKSSETSVHPRICRLVLPDDLEVPGHHELIVPGLVKGPVPSDLEELAGKSCLFESSWEGSGISVARVLGIVHDGRFPVRICNPLPKSVHLKKDKSLGILSVLDNEPVVAVVGEQDDLTDVLASEQGLLAEETLGGLAGDTEISKREMLVFKEFLQRNKEVFSLHGELGRYKGMPFTIDTGEARPIRQMPRKVPHHLKVEIDKQLDQMLEQGVIEPSSSPWASPICLVKKKDGSLRFCVDYRKLNAVTKADAFPIPNMGDCLSSLGGSKFFSALDLASGYWQVEMDRESAEKAAITTHRGLFQPKVLPFGVKGGVAHFSRVMSTLFSAFQWKILLIYLDDLLVFSEDFEEHLRRLGIVFDCLKKAGLKLKPSKCCFLRRSLKFLGHIVSDKGVSPDPDKLKAIHDFPVPQNLEEMRRFLGLAGYYRDHIPGFADIVHPLNELTKKDVCYNWSILCTEAFEKVKALLLSSPVLAFPDFQHEFILTTDASDTGLGAILSQLVDGKEKPIQYASRSLSKSEVNYCTSEKECLAVVWAVQYFSYFLLGKQFVVRTDHDPLTYLRSVPSPHGRLARWITWLEQFSYRMEYVPGKSIPHADALSRAPVLGEISMPVEVSMSQVQREQQRDGVIQRVVELWKSGKVPDRIESQELKQLFRVSKDFIYKNGVLCVKSSTSKAGYQLVLPRTLVNRVLKVAHDEAGHFATERTLAAVRARFYWGSMFNDVRNWCQSCSLCQGRENPGAKPRAPLQFTPIPSRVWQMVALDFLGPLVETKHGNKHVLVVTDKLSKYAIALPLPDQTAETTANALFYKVFCIYSFPDFLHSDQGRNFESAIIKQLCELTGVEKTRTTPYHPEGNGQTERHNRTLLGMLSKCIDAETQNDWDEWLPIVQFSYNTSVHSSTGIQPFELQFGRSSRTLLDLFVSESKFSDRQVPVSECLKKIKSQVSRQVKQAQGSISESMLKQKAHYDKKESFRCYKKGDLVLLREYSCGKGLKPKLMRERWTGPWRVVCQKSDVTYRVTKGTGKFKRKVVVHHNRLKSYIPREPELSSGSPGQSDSTSLGSPGQSDSTSLASTENDQSQSVGVEPGIEGTDPVGFSRGDLLILSDDGEEEETAAGDGGLAADNVGEQPEGGRRYSLRSRENIALPSRFRE